MICSSDKFNFDDIESNYAIWIKSNENLENNGLTYKSIQYWCRMENPEKYEEIRKESIEILINNTISRCDTIMTGCKGYKNDINDAGCDSDMAILAYYLYPQPEL